MSNAVERTVRAIIVRALATLTLLCIFMTTTTAAAHNLQRPIDPPWEETDPWAPNPPTNTRIVGKTDTSITIQWKDISRDETGFKVYRHVPSASRVFGVTSPNQNGTGNIISFTDKNLSAGTYCYTVRASNAHGESIRTNAGCALVPLPPEPPINLTLTDVQKRSIAVGWTDNSTNEDHFLVQRKRGNGDWYTVTEARVRDENHVKNRGLAYRYADGGLSPGTKYCYRIRAANYGGGSNTEERCVNTKPLEPPAAPSDLEITAVNESTISLTWKDNANNEDGFIVTWKGERSGYSDDDDTKTLESPNRESYTLNGLRAGHTYCVDVRAYNRDGESRRATTDCLTLASPGEETRDIWLKADPPYEGPLPYVAIWPPFGTLNGYLTRIKVDYVASGPNNWLHFVKRGYTTAQCGNPQAVVSVKQGESITSGQLEQIYGTSRPRFPISFVACASTEDLSIPNQVLIEISYVKD